MGGTDVSADHFISELLDMGFEFAKALEALEAVGPVLNDAVDFILNDSCNKNTCGKLQHAFTSSKTQNCSLGEDAKSSESLFRKKQSHVTDHFPSSSGGKRDISAGSSKPSFAGVKKAMSRSLEEEQVSVDGNNQVNVESSPYWIDCHSHIPSKELGLLSQLNGSFQCEQVPQFNNTDGQAMMLKWEQKVGYALRKHFGFSTLKGFQKEAINAWLAHKDCLILAATGSGKSLCFQIPALLSGKVVVVISPLISLMHDQCLKLAKSGISACFLGSGQPDSTVEQKAMNGVYRIVYVCPETVLRLIEPLRILAEKNMIALFAIDEVHCISKWGHDFRPDYRRLSVLRENFRASHMKSLRFDIPLMALTATATLSVREDVIKSLLMSKETKVVQTSFFRPNLRFSVKHSRTSFASSYDKDFHDLVNFYTASRMNNNSKGKNKIFNIEEDNFNCSSSSLDASCEEDGTSESDYCSSDDNHSCASSSAEDYTFPWGDQLTDEYLEDELDTCYSLDDWDVSCAEFPDSIPHKNMELFDIIQPPNTLESLGHGPTIIYVPTRKETTKLAEYFCRSGVRAAPYHAKLPKSQLRRVHEDFHQNLIEVIVATIAFGMGIDKSNVRRIIHYGWPQSLEAYYQEAGRAGRDGKLSDCILYADYWKCPTLLPNRRSEEQTRQAYKMLSDCFRYGMNTSTCRAKTLVQYFGEEFKEDCCRICDICVSGPPSKQSLMVEVNAFLHTLKAQRAYMDEISFGLASHIGAMYSESSRRLLERSNFMDVISKLREQNPKFVARDRVWWRGLARILEDMGFIKEADDKVRVSSKYPQLTKLGMEFLNSHAEEDSFYAHPYADMLLLSSKKDRPFSSFSEWGKGWADPEIRRRRLQGGKRRAKKKQNRTTRTKKSKRNSKDLNTVRGRLAAKLCKFK